MALCALTARALLERLGCEQPAAQLAAMVVTGAVTYVGAALVICRETARDLLDLGRRALLRRGQFGQLAPFWSNRPLRDEACEPSG
jgi:hypothetical protein